MHSWCFIVDSLVVVLLISQAVVSDQHTEPHVADDRESKHPSQTGEWLLASTYTDIAFPVWHSINGTAFSGELYHIWLGEVFVESLDKMHVHVCILCGKQ